MKYVLENNNFEVDGKQYLKDVGGYDGTNVDDSKDVATVISEIIISTMPEMISVTYNELVSLRDNSELIPGKQYRITDYVTTTSQENTISAGHQFDIIVTALDESTLSEEAKAIQNNNDGYFDSCNLQAWKIWYSLDNDINRFKWANTYECIYTSNCKPFVGYTSDVNDTFCFDDEIVAIARVLDDSSNGEFYETLDGGLNEVFTHFGYTDDIYGVKQLTLYCVGIEDGEYYGIEDAYHYKGIFTIDGEEYDAWARFVGDSSDNIKDGYSGSKSQNKIIYTLTNRIVDGEIISEPFGKGVIYRMIDEWGNDCPYDFKNIQFKREIYYDGLGIASTEGDGDFYAYCYTFSWEDSENGIKDASILGNNGSLLNDEGQINGVYGNIIGVHMDYYDYVENPQSTKQYLNDIVFFSTYGYEGNIYYGCYSNTFGKDCHSNTFGNECRSNTFGNECRLNTFGNRCRFNTFGNYCVSNIFGNYCDSNTFGNYCQSNTFGVNCGYNTFGNECNSNTFGNECSSNNFGDICTHNTFGSGCSNNIFGSGCKSNTFGDSCESNTFGDDCCNNTFASTCSSNNFGDICTSNIFGAECSFNTFGNNCYENEFYDGCSNNTFGNNCYENEFGGSCFTNTFGDYCHSNTFGNNCYSNTFSNYCQFNTFSNDCMRNTFSNYCRYNKFSNYCQYNTFSNDCYNNTFGSYCLYNTFGNNCKSNKFGTALQTKSYYRHIIFDNGNSYIRLNCTATTGTSNYYQNVRIGLGVNNTNTYKTISDSNFNQLYETLYRPTGSQTKDI